MNTSGKLDSVLKTCKHKPVSVLTQCFASTVISNREQDALDMVRYVRAEERSRIQRKKQAQETVAQKRLLLLIQEEFLDNVVEALSNLFNVK